MTLYMPYARLRHKKEQDKSSDIEQQPPFGDRKKWKNHNPLFAWSNSYKWAPQITVILLNKFTDSAGASQIVVGCLSKNKKKQKKLYKKDG